MYRKEWDGVSNLFPNLNGIIILLIDGFYSRSWLQEISSLEKDPILRTYIVFKEKKMFRNSYFMCISEKYQCAITRFRDSSHRLGIDYGWHQKRCIPVEERICKFCNLGEIGDEYLFLSNANSTQTPGQFFIPIYDYMINFDRLDGDEKFKQMRVSTNKEALHGLGKFIHDGFRSRDLLQGADFR